MRVAEMKRDMLRAANLKAAREAREERIREMQRIRGVVEVPRVQAGSKDFLRIGTS